MEHFFHLCPPFAWFTRCQGILQRFHHRPPFLRLLMSRHFGPIALHVAAVIFEVAEEKVVFEVDGIVADIALPNLV